MREMNSVVKKTAALLSMPQLAESTLVLSNLSSRMDVREIRDLCVVYGPLVQTYAFRSHGYAFISFRRSQDMRRAISDLSGRVICGHKIYADTTLKLPPYIANPMSHPGRVVILHNVAPEIDGTVLRELCEQYGSCRLFVPPGTTSTKNVTVVYRQVALAQAAINGLNGLLVGGETITTEGPPAIPFVRVSGLPSNISPRQIENHFGSFGRIRHIFKADIEPGVCLIKYSNQRAAERVVANPPRFGANNAQCELWSKLDEMEMAVNQALTSDLDSSVETSLESMRQVLS